jgi:hypothetical protein
LKRDATFRATRCCLEFPGFPPFLAVMQPMQPNFAMGP